MAAQVDHDPGDVPEEGDGDGGADEGQQGLHYSKTNDIISTLGSITCGTQTAVCEQKTSQHLEILTAKHPSIYRF